MQSSSSGFGRDPRRQHFNNPRTRGPEDMDGSRMVQGEVTVNCPFSVNFAASRLGAPGKDSTRIGAVMDRNSLNIFEGQALVKQVRSRLGNCRVRGRADHVFEVFSTFRGMLCYANDKEDRDLWNRSWMFAGFAKTNIEMNEVIGTNEVAASVAGGMTVKTNGYRPIVAGQFLKLAIPSPHEEDRNEVSKQAQAVGVNIDACAPSVVPEQPEDGIYFLQSLILNYINNNVLVKGPGRAKTLLWDYHNRNGSMDALKSPAWQFFFTEYIQGAAIDFAQNLALAERLGLATLNLPQQSASLNRLAQEFDALHYNDAALNSSAAGVVVEGDGSLNKVGAAGLVLDVRSQRVVALYGLLGLIKSAQQPSAGLRELIMLHKVNGLLPATQQTRTIRNSTSISRVGPRHDNRNDEEKAIDLLQVNRAREAYMSFHSCHQAQAMHRIGRATNSTKPGAEVDIVF